MKRPKKDDYLTTNQFEYQNKINQYYEDIEKYINQIEEENAELMSVVELLPNRGNIIEMARILRKEIEQLIKENDADMTTNPAIIEKSFITAAFYGRGLIKNPITNNQ